MDTSFARCQFLPYSQRNHAPKNAVVYDVSSYADYPYCTLSPFWEHGGIPVPGLKRETSDSVEGIWQGLKVINGATAHRLFRGRGKKRRGGKTAGHQYGTEQLGYLQARLKIYVVAYEWVLANRIEPSLLQQFVDQAQAGVAQYFHDVEENGNVHNISSPLAHAGVLVTYLNRLCEQTPTT